MTFKKITNFDQFQSISSELIRLGEKILTTNLLYTSGNSILIITDSQMFETEAQIWIQAGQQLGAEVQVFVVEGMKHSGEEPPDEIVAACGAADICIFQTTLSLTHTNAGKAAVLNNGRAASLPGATLDLLQRTLSSDPQIIVSLGEKVKTALEHGREITISGTNGTNLTAQIRQNAVTNDSSIISPGYLGNLPGGEVFFAPLLHSTSGKVIIDGAIADDVLDEPILIEIHNGKATNFLGGKAAERLEQKLLAVGSEGLVVAELGIGTNPEAHICENLLEAEKAYGTVHIAFGNSSAIGGENNVPIHIDGLITEPTVAVDGKVILKNKKFRL